MLYVSIHTYIRQSFMDILVFNIYITALFEKHFIFFYIIYKTKTSKTNKN